MRATDSLALVLVLRWYAQRVDLRNRTAAPERGWRLIDILGAPRRATTET